MSFKNLKQYEAQGTARYELYQLEQHPNVEGHPFLLLKPALSVNKPYFNGLLKRSRKNARKIQALQFDEAFIEENRADDRILYAAHVVDTWGNIVDDDGEVVSFSNEKALEFLNALPDWIFDDVRAFAREPQNFVQGPVPDAEEASGE